MCLGLNCENCAIQNVSEELTITGRSCEEKLLHCADSVIHFLSRHASPIYSKWAVSLLRQSNIPLVQVDCVRFLNLCLVEIQNRIALGSKNWRGFEELFTLYRSGFHICKNSSIPKEDVISIHSTFHTLLGQEMHLCGNYDGVVRHNSRNQESRAFKAQYTASLFLRNDIGDRALSRNITEGLFSDLALDACKKEDFFIAAKFLEHYEKVGRADQGLSYIKQILENIPHEYTSLSESVNLVILYRDIGQSMWLCGDSRYEEFLSTSYDISKSNNLGDQERKVMDLRKKIQSFESGKTVIDLSTANQDFFLCDYLVVTVRPDELDAAIYHIANNETESDKRPQWRRAIINHTSQKKSTVFFVSTGTPGNLPSNDYLFQILSLLKPHVIILLGIGGSVPCADVGLGDVVVGQRILDFSIGAVNADNTREYAVFSPGGEDNILKLSGPMITQWSREFEFWPQIKGYRTQEFLSKPWKELDDTHFKGNKQWVEKLKRSYTYHMSKNSQHPNAVYGTIATSDSVMKSPREVAHWLRTARDIRAIEMEASGVLLAAKRFSCPVVVVRGISDIVGQARDEEWTYYAVNSAAAFAGEMIRHQII